MTPFDRAFKHTVGVEGGYSDDPQDSGGATKYGITESVARANGFHGDLRVLTLAEAKRIYKAQYWDILRLDEIARIDEKIALELFDTAVNIGIATAGIFLQRALNELNRGGTDYRDLTVDDIVGPMTVAAMQAFIARRGDKGRQVLNAALNALQGAYYLELAESRPKDEAFVFGWFANRVMV